MNLCEGGDNTGGSDVACDGVLPILGISCDAQKPHGNACNLDRIAGLGFAKGAKGKGPVGNATQKCYAKAEKKSFEHGRIPRLLSQYPKFGMGSGCLQLRRLQIDDQFIGSCKLKLGQETAPEDR